MSQPPGFSKGDSSLVCKLHKAIYGLKQAPRAWFAKLSQTLVSLSFHSTKSDCSPFLKKTSAFIILVYVDDILLTSNSHGAIDSLIRTLNASFPLKDLGNLSFFLGIQVQRSNRGGIHLSQTKYIHELLQKDNMVTAKPMSTPMVTGPKLTADGGDPSEDPFLYRSIVGGLQYVTLTRPNISYAVNKVCQFMHRPQSHHWQAVKRILQYLCGTSTHGLSIVPSSHFNITAFCNSDWGFDLDDRKSTTGFCIYLDANLISWSSKKQQVVSRSSTEAEYRSIAATAADISWIQSLLHELQHPATSTPLILCDNLSVVLLSANPILHSRTKHFELDLYFVRDKVQQQQLLIHHIPSSEQTADILTKAVPQLEILSCIS